MSPVGERWSRRVSFLDKVVVVASAIDLGELALSRARILPDQSSFLLFVNADCGGGGDLGDEGTKTPTRISSSLLRALSGGVYERTSVSREVGSYAIWASFDGLVDVTGQ
jgi:hypothetical protein